MANNETDRPDEDSRKTHAEPDNRRSQGTSFVVDKRASLAALSADTKADHYWPTLSCKG